MCLDTIKDLLVNPPLAISKAKREKKYNTTFVILIVEWILIGLSLLVVSKGLEATQLYTLSVSVVLLGIVCSIFGGFLVQIVFQTLGGKGKYLDGLTTVVYAKFPIAIGFILSSILSLFSTVGIVLALIVMIVFAVLGISTLYRSIKELFAVDMVTALVGTNILIIGAILAVYIVISGVVLGKQQLLQLFGTGMAG